MSLLTFKATEEPELVAPAIAQWMQSEECDTFNEQLLEVAIELQAQLNDLIGQLREMQRAIGTA